MHTKYYGSNELSAAGDIKTTEETSRVITELNTSPLTI